MVPLTEKSHVGTDNQTARVLFAKSTEGQTNSLESCAAFCSGYGIFGTEYGEEVGHISCPMTK